MATDNSALIRGGFEAFLRGDFDALRSLLALVALDFELDLDVELVGNLHGEFHAAAFELDVVVATEAHQALSRPLTPDDTAAVVAMPGAPRPTPSSPGALAWRRCPSVPATPTRHRLDRGGNPQINAAIHRVAVTRGRCHPETRTDLDRKRSEGKSTKEPIRCLKRHLARRVWHLLQPPQPRPRNTAITINFLT